MIYLDPIELELRYLDGEVDRQRWRKGQVAWIAGGRLHTGENLIDRTARVVEVELKKPPSGKPLRTAARDPLKVNPKNVKAEFENEHVRVLRCKYPANVREPLHEHLSSELNPEDRELAVRFTDNRFFGQYCGTFPRIANWPVACKPLRAGSPGRGESQPGRGGSDHESAGSR